ncbi:hypothetical protein [Enterobacter asburiae]
MDEKKSTIEKSHFLPVDWHAMADDAHSSTDLMKEKLSQAVLSLQHQKDEVYRQAIEKHFGDFTEENAKQCRLVFDKGIEKLYHGAKILCEVYPAGQPIFPGATATYQITYTQKYRIY